MERVLVKAGSVDTCGDDGISAERLKDIHRVASQLQSLATTVSRLPQFPRRFTESVLASTVGSVPARPDSAV